MARANIISAIAANPQDGTSSSDTSQLRNVVWKIGDSVPGSPDLIVRQLVLFNGGVTVFALPSPGSKTELEFIQHTGTRQGFIFNLAASTIKMTVAMASADAYEEIRMDTYENADDNFDEEPDEPEEPEEEEEEELDGQIEAAPATPMVATTPAPSFLPSAETLSDSESP
jgi:hypothetical protein